MTLFSRNLVHSLRANAREIMLSRHLGRAAQYLGDARHNGRAQSNEVAAADPGGRLGGFRRTVCMSGLGDPNLCTSD